MEKYFSKETVKELLKEQRALCAEWFLENIHMVKDQEIKKGSIILPEIIAWEDRYGFEKCER